MSLAYAEQPDEGAAVTDDFYAIWCDGCGRRIEDDEDYGETDHTGQIFCAACWDRLGLDSEED